MNNFYNNNQRGYGNQFQPKTSIYQQQGYIPPGRNFYNQGNYNQPNNYNPSNNYNPPNNYNQQSNYNPNQNLNQNQNNGPKIFIAGKIGRMEISAEDLETFSKSLKSAEWTNNPNYLQAKNIDVKMKLSLKGQLQSDITAPRNRFNDFNINSNFNYDEYEKFVKDTEDEYKRKKDESEKEKNEFLRVNFPNEKPDISNDDLYKKIKEKKKDIISKDSNLYGKVERLIPLLKSEDNSGPAEPAKKGEMFDFKSANNDVKVFVNTPGVIQ